MKLFDDANDILVVCYKYWQIEISHVTNLF